ncbi:hypothetical protein PYCC9005_001352 [Savitreella phatthalungensis]
MLRSVSRALSRPTPAFRTCAVHGARSNSTQGPLKAEVTSDVTHKDKDEAVLARAREVAKEVAAGTQSPNREVTWSNSQQPRQLGMRGPRFEQTDFSLQPQPQAAIELIAQQPIRYETKRVVSCDGGGGALGHPKVYINLDKHGEPNVCPYCGIRFQMHEHRADQLSSTGGN